MSLGLSVFSNLQQKYYRGGEVLILHNLHNNYSDIKAMTK